MRHLLLHWKTPTALRTQRTQHTGLTLLLNDARKGATAETRRGLGRRGVAVMRGKGQGAPGVGTVGQRASPEVRARKESTCFVVVAGAVGGLQEKGVTVGTDVNLARGAVALPQEGAAAGHVISQGGAAARTRKRLPKGGAVARRRRSRNGVTVKKLRAPESQSRVKKSHPPRKKGQGKRSRQSTKMTKAVAAKAVLIKVTTEQERHLQRYPDPGVQMTVTLR